MAKCKPVQSPPPLESCDIVGNFSNRAAAACPHPQSKDEKRIAPPHLSKCTHHLENQTILSLVTVVDAHIPRILSEQTW